MTDLDTLLDAALPSQARAWLADALGEATRAGAAAMTTALPALPRRVGRTALGRGRHREGDATVELGAWRACDAAGLRLLRAARCSDDALVALFAHGDIEERAMVMRAATVLPLSGATLRLLGEAQRSNTQPHFEALCCDCDLLARAGASLPGFDAATASRVVLKAAFLGIRLHRMFGAEQLANPDLSRMLQDLATEREAAGRGVWADTLRLAARAPVPGTLARIAGDLEHGDDERRLAAAEAAALVADPRLRPFLEARGDREPRPAIREACAAALRVSR